MTMGRGRSPRTDPAHTILYEPGRLSPPRDPAGDGDVEARVRASLENPFNDRQTRALSRSFTDRVSLLWGPPGTGKTTVLAAIVLGWFERAWLLGEPLTIGVCASNYNAMDNLLTSIADLLERRSARAGEPPVPATIARVRSSSAQPPADGRFADVERDSAAGLRLARELDAPSGCTVVGGTWMQLEKLAKASSPTEDPVARWFDLLLIDEASQMGVAYAAAYFLLLKDDANVVLAGDHRQLGPIYGFQMDNIEDGLFDCIFTYMQEAHAIDPTALDQNYRTNAEIAAWPRERFYGEGYEAFQPKRRLALTLPDAADASPVGWPEQLPWSGELLKILDPDLPVAVVTYEAQTHTLSNPFEAQVAAALSLLYRRLLERDEGEIADDEFWGERLGIVTPHRAQMANIRNLLEHAAGMRPTSLPFVDTVDRFQGQERDMVISSYTVADRDFVASEEGFILDPRRFNVTLTRARSKFVMFVSEAVLQHLPSDADAARDAAHLQLFVENYCSAVDEEIVLPFANRHGVTEMKCRLRGRRHVTVNPEKRPFIEDELLRVRLEEDRTDGGGGNSGGHTPGREIDNRGM